MLPWLLCIGLGLLALYLGGKVYGLRRTMEDIGDRLETWLDEDSNTLLTLTASRDPYARRLLRRLNDQLRLLRQQRRRWQQGDRELKEAVTNIAHDLRTPLPPSAAIWTCWTGRNTTLTRRGIWRSSGTGRRP